MSGSKQNFKAIALAVMIGAGGVMPSQSFAAYTVVDVGNMGNHIISMVESLAQTAQQASQIQQDIQYYQRQYESLKGLKDSLSDAGLTYNELRSYQRALNSVIGAANRGQEYMTELTRQYATSDARSWEEFGQHQQEAYERDEAMAVQNFNRARQINDDLSRQYETIQKHGAAVSSVTGTQSGFQALGAQMQLVTKQNAQMLELLSAKQTKESLADKENTERKKRLSESAKEYREQIDKQLEADRARWERLNKE